MPGRTRGGATQPAGSPPRRARAARRGSRRRLNVLPENSVTRELMSAASGTTRGGRTRRWRRDAVADAQDPGQAARREVAAGRGRTRRSRAAPGSWSSCAARSGTNGGPLGGRVSDVPRIRSLLPAAAGHVRPAPGVGRRGGGPALSGARRPGTLLQGADAACGRRPGVGGDGPTTIGKLATRSPEPGDPADYRCPTLKHRVPPPDFRVRRVCGRRCARLDRRLV